MSKPVILCVDDDRIVLSSLRTELTDALGDEYLIETAEGGEEALKLIEEWLADRYEIPLVISDYMMPNMKGDELLKRIHALSPKTRKVMLTGQADLEPATQIHCLWPPLAGALAAAGCRELASLEVHGEPCPATKD